MNNHKLKNLHLNLKISYMETAVSINARLLTDIKTTFVFLKNKCYGKLIICINIQWYHSILPSTPCHKCYSMKKHKGRKINSLNSSLSRRSVWFKLEITMNIILLFILKSLNHEIKLKLKKVNHFFSVHVRLRCGELYELTDFCPNKSAAESFPLHGSSCAAKFSLRP